MYSVRTFLCSISDLADVDIGVFEWIDVDIGVEVIYKRSKNDMYTLLQHMYCLQLFSLWGAQPHPHVEAIVLCIQSDVMHTCRV